MSVEERAGQTGPLTNVGLWREDAERVESEHPHMRALGRWAAGTVFLAGAVAAGASVGVELPTHVVLSRELSVDASLHHSDESVISTGATGSLHLPKAVRPVPVLGNVAVHLDINEINIINPTAANLDTFVAMRSDPKDTIQKPIEHALIWRASEGGAAGGAVAIGLFVGVAALRRHKRDKRNMAQTKRELEDLKERTNDPDVREDIEHILAPLRSRKEKKEQAKPPAKMRVGRKEHEVPLQKRRVVRIAGGIALAGVLAGFTYGTTAALQNNDKPIDTTPLSSTLTDQYPILEDATVSGIGGWAFNEFFEKVEGYKNNSDTVWKDDAKAFNVAFKAFKNGGGLAYQSDPNIAAVLQISDVHCNLPYMKYYLPKVIRKFGVNTVINSGDSYTTVNTLPTEGPCMTTMVDAVSPKNQKRPGVQIVYVAGNHDPAALPSDITHIKFKGSDGKDYYPITELGGKKHKSVTVDGITYVSEADPTRSGQSGTIPKGIGEQLHLVAKQGQKIAAEACAIKTESGIAPVVIGHQPQSTYEAIMAGCASTALSGHLHVTQPVKRFAAANGQQTLQEVVGTASGAGSAIEHAIGTQGLTEYSPAQIDATARLHLFNKLTGETVGYIDITASPEGVVTITPGQLPDSSQSVSTAVDNKLNSFLDQFSSAPFDGLAGPGNQTPVPLTSETPVAAPNN